MTLIKTGQGVTDIRGGLGGVYFTRDKSGLHCTAKPRRVHQQTTAQKIQRDAFIKARTYTKDPRWVSYYMYRLMNGLPLIFDAIVTGDPEPDCTGKYEDQGIFNNERYYKRTDSAYFLYANLPKKFWYISATLGNYILNLWRHPRVVEGTYDPVFMMIGNPIVEIELRPPPPDYQIPKL